jgi:hypothetical protein
MSFSGVKLFSSQEHPVNPPLVFYRDPQGLYLWFSKTGASVMHHFGWREWKPGASIAEVLNG